MQIQVHTDSNFQGGESLAEHVTSVVEGTLARFSDRITRVEVHLMDESSAAKSGGNDKRCSMEARVGGLKPIAVTHDSETAAQAIDGAADKLLSAIVRTLGKLGNVKGRTSFGGDQSI